CGACGTACPFTTQVSGTSCASSACKVTSCNAGFADCDVAYANGCEANLTNSDAQTNAAINHCGACGMACPFTTQVSGTSCASSACKVTACNAGFADCNTTYADGCEANLTNSDGQTNAAINHCGACGMACPFTASVSGTSCVASACKITSCNAGTGDCNTTYGDGCEANTNTSD